MARPALHGSRRVRVLRESWRPRRTSALQRPQAVNTRRFERQDTETLIERKDIRTIRLRPRKTTRYKYRLLGLLVGIPAGFGAGAVSSLACCLHDGASGSEALGNVVFFGALIAVPYWFYKLGARADRGTVLIVLDESAPDSSRDGSQAERPSSAKEERP